MNKLAVAKVVGIVVATVAINVVARVTINKIVNEALTDSAK